MPGESYVTVWPLQDEVDALFAGTDPGALA